MKVIWGPNDIISGRRYSRDGLAEKWIIGCLSTAESDERYVSVSELDGMVTNPHTKEQLAAMLTENAYLPVEIL